MRFWYAGIRVRNLDRSLDFYKNVMGMKETRRGKMPHGGVYVGLRYLGHDMELELNYYPPGNRFATRYVRGEELDHLGFVVSDPLKVFKRLVRAGATIALGPDSKGTELYVKDPDGIWLELCKG
jgi:catechol 2,3-dioxygenase-like lactoylglutathione lyase family enzyme